MKPLVTINVCRRSILKEYHYLIHDAVALFNLIIIQPAFKNTIQAFSFDWRNCPYQIKDQFVFETLFQHSKQHTMQIQIKKSIGKFASLTNEMLGTTVVGSSLTTINENWISSLPKDHFETVIEVAAHIAHEYCHQRGFYDGKHRGQVNVVPYFIGDLVYDLSCEKSFYTNIYKL